MIAAMTTSLENQKANKEEVRSDREVLNGVDKINYQLVKEESLNNLSELEKAITKSRVFKDDEIQLAEIAFESICRINGLGNIYKPVKVISLETHGNPKTILKMRIKDLRMKLSQR